MYEYVIHVVICQHINSSLVSDVKCYNFLICFMLAQYENGELQKSLSYLSLRRIKIKNCMNTKALWTSVQRFITIDILSFNSTR